MKLQISQIIMDHQAQPRTEINSTTIQEYAEVWKDGAGFPPITVFSDGDNFWLADGWHRVLSAKVAKVPELEADVKPGILRDAILYSAGANAIHGMRRTNADKRRAVETLLKDPEWVTRSDRWIAEQCAVNNKWVGDIRKQVCTVHTSPDTRTGQDGKQYPPTPQPKPSEPEPVQSHPEEPKPTKSQFNRTNENIDWAAWSWNPVTGCELNCEYCYARDIANRFYPEGFKPTFHPERLDAPSNTNPLIGVSGGNKVFVCSMADLFGAWVPNDWIWPVIKAAEDNPQWIFIFLTKNPRRLASINFPGNAWVGCTVDIQARVKPAEDAMSRVNASHKFLSCEPMLEPLQFNDLSIFDWVIIGAQSKASQVPEFQPDFWWWHQLADEAHKAGCKVFCKPNLTSMPKEYPGAK